MTWSRVRNFFVIFHESDAPLTTKVRMAVRNNVKKIRTRQPCCGHPGEPGC